MANPHKAHGEKNMLLLTENHLQNWLRVVETPFSCETLSAKLYIHQVLVLEFQMCATFFLVSWFVKFFTSFELSKYLGRKWNKFDDLQHNKNSSAADT